jgi:hypothetical protein
MNGSGMLYTDAVLLCIIVYAFWCGWAVTLAGEVLSVLVMRQPGRGGLGVVLAIGCLAPFPYAMFWALLDRFMPVEPETSDPWTYVVMAGLAVCVFAAPLTALVCIVRAPRRENAPS